MAFLKKVNTREYSLSALKKVVCIIAAGAVAVLSGCDDKANMQQSSISSTTTQTDKKESNLDTLKEVRLDTPVLHFLGSYDLGNDEQIAEAKELYLQTYAAEYYDESADTYSFPDGGSAVIESEVVMESKVNELLSERIQSDTSPDLVDVPQDGFPYKMSYMYEDISANMNISAPQWEDFSEYINAYGIQSKRFFYPWKVSIADERLYYNRTLFEQFGIPDPAEQWAAGEWTWDAFLSAINTFTAAVDGSIGVYGDDLSAGFVASSGAAVITRGESGEFVSGILSEDIERAVLWVDDNLLQTALYSTECIGYAADSALPAAIGLSAFRAGSSGDFANYCSEYSEYDMWNVPYPTDPTKDEGCYSVELFGYLVPNGAKNVQGACCFINCCRISQANAPTDAQKARVMLQNGYTDEEYEFMEQFSHSANFNTVLDLSSSDPGGAAAFKDMCAHYYSSAGEISWKSLCKENAPAFERAAAELNALLE